LQGPALPSTPAPDLQHTPFLRLRRTLPLDPRQIQFPKYSPLLWEIRAKPVPLDRAKLLTLKLFGDCSLIFTKIILTAQKPYVYHMISIRLPSAYTTHPSLKLVRL